MRGKRKGTGLFSTTPAWSSNYRQWRLPEDFFNSFFPRDRQGRRRSTGWSWPSMKSSGRCSALPVPIMFRELGRGNAAQTPWRRRGNQNHDLQEIKEKFRSQEKFFYPFANTKMIRWPIAERPPRLPGHRLQGRRSCISRIFSSATGKPSRNSRSCSRIFCRMNTASTKSWISSSAHRKRSGK